MKRTLSLPRRHASSGFTLVELLVVIGIIAILASAVTVAASSAIKAAKRAKAANTASQINTAVLNYYTEYSVYPVPVGTPASADLLIDDATAAPWKNLLYGLCGNVNPYDSSTTANASAAPNSRGIPFLTLKKSDVDKNGGLLNPLPTGTANPYFNLAIDNDYDNIVGDSGTAAGKIIDFGSSTTATIKYYAATTGVTGGTAVWANCNGTGTNPTFYVRTY